MTRRKRKLGRNLAIGLALTLGLGLGEPIFNPAPADAACFFWQRCNRGRGATNTRAGGKRTGRIRGGNDASIPYVITPRNSWISAQNLPETLQWNPVEGVERYTVRLWQWTYERDARDFPLLTFEVEGTNEVEFPMVALEQGLYYSFEIITEDGVSSNDDEGYYHSGFQLMFEEDYGELQSRLEELNSINHPSSEAEALVQAGVYFLDEMYADALQILEALAQNPGASDLVYSSLGDTYSRSGLNDLAIEAYDQSLTLVAEPFDEAGIRVRLADVYATERNFAQARQELIAARQNYREIAADPQIAAIDRRISVLSILQSLAPTH